MHPLEERSWLRGGAECCTWWIAGTSESGTTTLARIIAPMVPTQLAVDEIDFQVLTPAQAREVEDRMGSKSKKPVIVNDAHGLRR